MDALSNWVRLETTSTPNVELAANQVRWITLTVPSTAGYTWYLVSANTNSGSSGIMGINIVNADTAMVRSFSTQAQTITINGNWIGIKNSV